MAVNDDRDSEQTENRLEGIRSRLFDADRKDRILSFDEAIGANASPRQLLWIDVQGDLDDERRRALIERFKLPAGIEGSLSDGAEGSEIRLHGHHFELRVAVEPDPRQLKDGHWLDIVAGPNLVITRHDGPIELLEGLNTRIAADASIGELDSAEFVAALLEAVVTSYHAAIDAIEDELDVLDERALAGRASDRLFDGLVGIRRRVGGLRRLIAAHREVFEWLGRPDFGRGIESADPAVFQPVTDRFEGAIASVESTREVVLASFEVLMTRTAQRTNEVMRVLTLVTVLGLPATITAGFLGMNVLVPVASDAPGSFWLIVGFVLVVELALIGIARWRGWI